MNWRIGDTFFGRKNLYFWKSFLVRSLEEPTTRWQDARRKKKESKLIHLNICNIFRSSWIVIVVLFFFIFDVNFLLLLRLCESFWQGFNIHQYLLKDLDVLLNDISSNNNCCYPIVLAIYWIQITWHSNILRQLECEERIGFRRSLKNSWTLQLQYVRA